MSKLNATGNNKQSSFKFSQETLIGIILMSLNKILLLQIGKAFLQTLGNASALFQANNVFFIL